MAAMSNDCANIFCTSCRNSGSLMVNACPERNSSRRAFAARTCAWPRGSSHRASSRPALSTRSSTAARACSSSSAMQCCNSLSSSTCTFIVAHRSLSSDASMLSMPSSCANSKTSCIFFRSLEASCSFISHCTFRSSSSALRFSSSKWASLSLTSLKASAPSASSHSSGTAKSASSTSSRAFAQSSALSSATALWSKRLTSISFLSTSTRAFKASTSGPMSLKFAAWATEASISITFSESCKAKTCSAHSTSAAMCVRTFAASCK
mmetsp:Transcript_55149/g.159661  ORF Transcript_55149/g.159661 Transcript_55149/m.159661 type:complete len:265 (-) Transcript_55149:1246-2040(-)